MTLDPAELAKIALDQSQQQSILTEAARLKRERILPPEYTYQGVDGATGRAILRSADGGELRERDVISSGGIPQGSRIAKKNQFVDAVPGVVPTVPRITRVLPLQNYKCAVLYEKFVAPNAIETWLGGDREEPLFLRDYAAQFFTFRTTGWNSLGTFFAGYQGSNNRWEFNQNHILSVFVFVEPTLFIGGNLSFEVQEATEATVTVEVVFSDDNFFGPIPPVFATAEYRATIDDGSDINLVSTLVSHVFGSTPPSETLTGTVTLAPGVHNFRVSYTITSSTDGLAWHVKTSLTLSPNKAYPPIRYHYLSTTEEKVVAFTQAQLFAQSNANPLALDGTTYWRQGIYSVVNKEDDTLDQSRSLAHFSPSTPVTTNPLTDDPKKSLFSFAFANNTGNVNSPAVSIYDLPPDDADFCLNSYRTGRGTNIVTADDTKTLYQVDVSSIQAQLLTNTTVTATVEAIELTTNPSSCDTGQTTQGSAEILPLTNVDSNCRIIAVAAYPSDE